MNQSQPLTPWGPDDARFERLILRLSRGGYIETANLSTFYYDVKLTAKGRRLVRLIHLFTADIGGLPADEAPCLLALAEMLGQ